MCRRADGDESSGRMEETFHEWADRVAERLGGGVAKKEKGKVGLGKVTKSIPTEAAETIAYDTEEEEGSGGELRDGEDAGGSEDDLDMEDIGGGNGGKTERREMVTPQLRKALTKQGYKILGSHSGVTVSYTHLTLPTNREV